MHKTLIFPTTLTQFGKFLWFRFSARVARQSGTGGPVPGAAPLGRRPNERSARQNPRLQLSRPRPPAAGQSDPSRRLPDSGPMYCRSAGTPRRRGELYIIDLKESEFFVLVVVQMINFSIVLV